MHIIHVCNAHVQQIFEGIDPVPDMGDTLENTADKALELMELPVKCWGGVVNKQIQDVKNIADTQCPDLDF